MANKLGWIFEYSKRGKTIKDPTTACTPYSSCPRSNPSPMLALCSVSMSCATHVFSQHPSSADLGLITIPFAPLNVRDKRSNHNGLFSACAVFILSFLWSVVKPSMFQLLSLWSFLQKTPSFMLSAFVLFSSIVGRRKKVVLMLRDVQSQNQSRKKHQRMPLWRKFEIL